MPAKSRLNLREFLRIGGLFSLLVCAGFLATGCSKQNNSETETTAINVRVWRYNQEEDIIKQIIDSFVESNSGVALNVTYSNRKLDSYELDSLKSLAARTGPDIWSIPSDWVADHTPRIEPLPETYFYAVDSDGNPASTGTSPVDSIKKLFPTGIAEQIISDDGKTVLGIPSNVDSLRLYYNPSLFQDATEDFRESLGENDTNDKVAPVTQLLNSAPTTWSDLVEQTKYLTKRDGNTITRSAIALGSADNITSSNDILQLLMLQNGIRVVSTDRKSALFHIPTTTPSGLTIRPGEKALDFFTSFSNPNKATYTWNPSMPQDIDAFAQGKVAMLIGFSDLADTLKIKYPRFDYEVAPLPQNSTVDAPINFIRFSLETVTKTADSSAAAFALLKRYTDVSSSRNIAKQKGLISPYLETIKDEASDPLIQQIATGQTVYKKSRPLFDQAFRQMVIDVTQNGLTTDKALDKGAELINTLLRNTTTL